MSLSNQSARNFYVSTISGNPIDIFKDLETINKSKLDGIHFDVMDGIFVPRLGLYPELLKQIRLRTNLPIEVHCMLTKPSLYVQQMIDFGANRLLFHIETADDLVKLISTCKEMGVESGLVLNPETEINHLRDYLHLIDCVMLMGIRPGVPKHSLIEKTYQRVAEVKVLKELFGFRNIMISVDGGVTFENIAQLFESGAEALVCGSHTIFNPNFQILENIKRLESLKEG